MCATCGCSNDDVAVHSHRRNEPDVFAGASKGEYGHRYRLLRSTSKDWSLVVQAQHSRRLQELAGDQSAGEPGVEHARLHGRTISLEQQILAKNDLLAEQNRDWLAKRNILALNLVSSPGSGKTTLLERTIRDLKETLEINVIEGDQATFNDAERIRATGCRAIQINTGTGCHLDAKMLARGLVELNPPSSSVVMVENVGNLVCPALFDLGEQAKVVILSVTEGEDKPVKYPHMFRAARLMVLNKIDLLPYLKFDVGRCIDYARTVNPGIRILLVSAMTGEGFADWYDWLRVSLAYRVESVPQ